MISDVLLEMALDEGDNIDGPSYQFMDPSNDPTSELDPQAEPTTAQLEAEVIEQGKHALTLTPKGVETLAGLAKQAVPITSQQARVHEVTDALAPAYAKASMLELTDEEIAQLQAEFPDELVEVRPHDGLIYIPHIHLSNRLNRVLRPGKWATICRRHWLDKQMAERMVDGKKQIVDSSVMYGEYVLVVRGCYVGESIGGHPYVASNPKTNFSDALESTRAEALRRICGKSLGVGSQVWDPGYSKRWVQAHVFQQNGKYYKKPPGTNQPQGTSAPPPSPAGNPPRQSGAPATKRTAAGPPQADLNAVADAANATRTRRTPPPPQSATQQAKTAPAPPPAAAQGHSCPKCRGTATKESQDYEGVSWCQRCGWQWERGSGQYWEAHDWAWVICPKPPKGVKLDEYRKNPQTLGQISRIDNKRWFGLVMNNSEEEMAKGYTSPTTGKHWPASQADLDFGRACEDAVAYLEEQKEGHQESAKQRAQDEADPEDDVPF